MCHVSYLCSESVASFAILDPVAFSTDCASRATDPDIVGYMSQAIFRMCAVLVCTSCSRSPDISRSIAGVIITWCRLSD